MPANQEILDAFLRHEVDVRGFSNRESRQILDLLERSDRELVRMLRERMPRIGPDFTAERWRALLRDMRQARRAVMSDIRSTLRGDLRELAQIEAQAAQRIAQAAIPVEFAWAQVDLQRLRQVVVDFPWQAGTNSTKSLAQWIESLQRSDYTRVRDALQLGVSLGESTDEIVRRVAGRRSQGFRDGELAKTRRQAEAIVRTGVNHVSNAARGEFFAANDDVIKALRWTSTLDSRTTPVCRARDGRFTPIGGVELPSRLPRLRAPNARPPAHVNCRSTMIPVLDPEGFADGLSDRPFVLDPGDALGSRSRHRRVDFRLQAQNRVGEGRWRQMGARQRRLQIADEKLRWSKGVIGQVPAKETYQTWLSRQNRAFQIQVLGDRRARLFRRGGLTLDKFVDRNGNQLTLKQLEQRHPEAFMRAEL